MLVCIYRTISSVSINNYLHNNLNFVLIYTVSRESYLKSNIRQMVLDLLIWIRSYVDRTLAFRSSCCEGVCGSCAMLINNINTLACVQPIWLISSYIIVYPLPHFNVIRDVVVDLKHFYEQYLYINPFYYIHDISGFSDTGFSYYILYLLRLHGYVLSKVYSLYCLQTIVIGNSIQIYYSFFVCCFIYAVIFDMTINNNIINRLFMYSSFIYILK